jgi:hypothetical protein
MSKQISPAAQAVIDASWGGIPSGMRDPYVVRCEQMAAAIRAAVDQVLPEIQEPDWGACDYMHCDIELYTDHERKRSALLAIAAELEAQP